MKVYLASDHAGFELKASLVDSLRAQGHEVEDLGPTTLDPTDDYPRTIAPLAQKVASEEGSFGIAIGLSGQGEAMEANRVKGVRAAVFYGGPDELVVLSRQHNDANILSLGAKFVSAEEAQRAVALWLATPFSNEERHMRRIKELDGN